MPATPPRRLISEFQSGDFLEDHLFLVHQKDLRTTNNGSLYIHAVFADHSGQIVARKWDASKELFADIPLGGYLFVRGRVESYKNRPQLIIDGVRSAAPDDVDPLDFLPRGAGDPEQQWERVKAILRTIEHPDLLAVVGKFINDESFERDFKLAPAAVAMHHAYLGGLIEHTLNLLELALLVLPRYPALDRDVVLAGVFLHDAGKTAELGYASSFSYTTEGQLVGHIVMCVSWIDQKVREIAAERQAPLDEERLNLLRHIIVAHHGAYEFGSPKLPAAAEAMFVHYLDNIDAKMAMFQHHVQSSADDDSDWTSYVNGLQTRIYKGPADRRAAAPE